MLRRHALGLPFAALLPRPAFAQAAEPVGVSGAGPTAAPAKTLGPALGVTLRPLVFPADFGAHPDTRTEWWYATGVLQVGSGSAAGPSGAAAKDPGSYGFQITFFRSRTGVALDHPSRFAASQLVFAHAAVSDLSARKLRHDQRVARAGFGIAEATEGDTAVRLRDWRLVRSGPPGQSRYQAVLQSSDAAFGLALQLDTTQPLLLQGQAGYSRKGPDAGQASHYYSQPQLAVTGQLSLDGRSHAVSGRAWLDHEWSNTLLHPEAVGWDWIGMNLTDGSALTAFRLRRADGSAVFGGGSFRATGGAVRSFGPDEVHFTPQRHWVSPASQARYPVAWTVRTPAGEFTVAAAFDDQELDSRRSTGSIYWEGYSQLTEVGGTRTGEGYLEMTGYAARLQL